MNDSSVISELSKYRVSGYYNGNGARCIAFFMSPKQWTNFRKKFNDNCLNRWLAK